MPLAVAQIACDTNTDARSVCGRYTFLLNITVSDFMVLLA